MLRFPWRLFSQGVFVMLSVLLQILLVIGWILLILLGVVACALLFILFLPFGYKILWQKYEQAMQLSVNIRWFFGLLTSEFNYPDTGTVIIKFMGIKVYDSGKASRDSSKDNSKEKEASKSSKQNEISGSIASSPKIEASRMNDRKSATFQKESSDKEDSNVESEIATDTSSDSNCDSASKKNQIVKKIKFYLNLLQEEDTKQLFSHALNRLCNILKNIRPKMIQGEITFGTGSPDTTGYLMAIYGIIYAFVGEDIIVTPDFEEKLLKGFFIAKGKLLLSVILYNILKVLSDHKLRILFKKLKREVM